MPCQAHSCISTWSHKTQQGVFTKVYNRLLARAKKEGYKVVPHCRNLPVQGRIYYKRRLIHINTPCFNCAIRTLAHELGHHEDRKHNGRHRSKKKREQMADYYGYQIYKTRGASMTSREYYS